MTTNELYAVQANAYAAMSTAQFLCSTFADLADFNNRARDQGKLVLTLDPLIDDYYVFPDGSEATVYGTVQDSTAIDDLDDCPEFETGLFGDY